MKKLFLFLALLILPSVSMWAQTCSNNTSNSSGACDNLGSCTINFTGAQTAGHTNIVTIFYCRTGGANCDTDPTGLTITSVMDTTGNTYSAQGALTGLDTLISGSTGNKTRVSTFVAQNIGSHGAGNTVTFTFSSNQNNQDVMLIAECTGIAASYDVSAGAVGVADVETATTGSTSVASEIVYAVGGPGTATSGALTSGYTGLSSTSLLIDGWKTVGSTGAQSATLTQSGGGTVWNHVHVVTLKQTGGGAVAVPLRPLMGVGR